MNVIDSCPLKELKDKLALEHKELYTTTAYIKATTATDAALELDLLDLFDSSDYEFTTESLDIKKRIKQVKNGLSFLQLKSYNIFLNKLANKLLRHVDQYDAIGDKLIRKKAFGLPKYKDTKIIMQTLEDTLDLMQQYAQNPKSVTFNEVESFYKKIGIQVPKVGKGWEDWKLIAVRVAGVAVSLSLFSIASAVLGMIGGILGITIRAAFKAIMGLGLAIFNAFKITSFVTGMFGLSGALYGDDVAKIFKVWNLKAMGWTSASKVTEEMTRLSVCIHKLDHISRNVRFPKGFDIDPEKDKMSYEEAMHVAKIMKQTAKMSRRLMRRLCYAFFSIETFTDKRKSFFKPKD